jgi:4-amino-4-deoxy-L-arabinose transferase-like glycosyltransferase
MLGVLPVVAFAFLYVLFQTRSGCCRASFLNAAVAWGVIVVFVSEGLSVINALTPIALAVVWSATDLFLACGACCSLIGFRITPRPALTFHSQNLDWADFLLLAGVSVIIVLVGLTALLSPPNTSDVMTYHLPRVVHWLQQRSLAFYPTRDLRQLVQPPGAEFCVFQLHAIAGSDCFDNLLQWWSYVGSAIGVSLVASELGAGTRGQVVASVVCATIPQGILTASSADSDYLLSFWLVALIWYLLHYSRHPNSALIWGIGGALGLAILTKGTAVVLIAPLLLCLSVIWTLATWKRLMAKIPLVILVVAMINLGYWVRTTRRYGFPLNPAAAPSGWQMKYTNHIHNLGSTASNVVKNMTLHFGTIFPSVNSATQYWAVAAIHLFKANENDPATTYPGTAFEIPPFNLDPDTAGNPFHLVLILVTLVIILVSPSLRRSQLSLYALGLVGAFVAFCAVFRWQPWHTRLHLPLFVLWSSIIGVVFERQFRRLITDVLGAALILAAIPATLLNETRPLITHGGLSVITTSRERLYFSARPSLFDSYRKAASLITESSCQSVGIDIPGDGYEYPWMVLLGIRPGGRQIRYIGDDPIPLGDDSVCAVICERCRPLRFAGYNSKFGAPRTFETVAVFGPSSAGVRGQ